MLISVLILTSSVHAFEIQYDGKTVEYTGSLFDLKINNKSVSMPLAPLIFNDRALVPVREVFETLGATVNYEEKTKCITVEYNQNKISLYINKSSAYINGKKTEIPDNAVPMLINKTGESAKTMVPVRFISENLNLNVKFKDNTIYVSNTDEKEEVIQTPSPTPRPTLSPTPPPASAPLINAESAPVVRCSLNSISFCEFGETSVQVTGALTGVPSSTEAFILSNPARLVVDLYNCSMNTPQTSYPVNIRGVSAVRLGYENNRIRIVLDASVFSYAKVTISNNTITVIADSTGTPTSTVEIENISTYTSSGSSTASESTDSEKTFEEITIIPASAYSGSDKLIVIDAGHGGSDSGAIGTLNQASVYEKDLTLSMALKVRDILRNNGYHVEMTRETDTYPTLQARAIFANDSNAAIFVSIHINSVSGMPNVSGTEVYYSSINNGSDYGVKSSTLAKNIQDALIAELSSKNRGVKQAEHVVTRTSLMPAALVEVGFISNEEELKNMASDEYQNKVANAIAAGITKTIVKTAIPANKAELAEQRRKDLEEWEK